ncbi:MAG: N-acyl homoserine lactonase family protein [Eubacteriales bacterium]
MNKNWKITCLDYGTLTAPKGLFCAGIDDDLVLPFVYSGFLLQDGKSNILIDTGVHQDNIVDGKAWAGCPAVGGNQKVLNALKEEGLQPVDIDIVMYTHLHNDHAGGLALFPDALTILQKDEIANMLNPLPSQLIRGDYDPRTKEDIKKLTNIRIVDGDFDMDNGIKMFKVPGHTLGGVAFQVQTKEGKYVITGDMPHLSVSLFPKLDKMELADGRMIDITPAPEEFGPYVFNSVIYDHYAANDSFNKLTLIAEEFDPKWYLTGHDIWPVRRKYFG